MTQKLDEVNAMIETFTSRKPGTTKKTKSNNPEEAPEKESTGE